MSDPRAALQGIQERADKATPGPWEASDANEGDGTYRPYWMVTNDEFHNPSADEDAPWLAVELQTGIQADAEFIAHARADVPKLVAALRAVLDFTVGDKTPIWVGIALDEIITDALGGTDA